MYLCFLFEEVFRIIYTLLKLIIRRYSIIYKYQTIAFSSMALNYLVLHKSINPFATKAYFMQNIKSSNFF